MDLAVGAPHPAALIGGRLALSGVLFGITLRLTPQMGRGEASRVLVAGAFLGAAAFGLLAWGAGGRDGAYLAFLPLLPLVITIAVPDEPAVPLVCGTTAAAAGLSMEAAAGASAARLALWVMAFSSSTLYGWVGSLLWRRMRQKERDAEARRARALEELAQAQRRTAQSERLATLGRLASSVAHEINNPLAYMGANLRFLRERLARSESFAKDAELRLAFSDTLEGLERIAGIVTDLNGFARRGDDDPEHCGLQAALDEALRLASVRLKSLATVESRLEAGLPLVNASHARMVEIFLGLLMNSADALEERARAEPAAQGAPRITISARREGDRVRVEVEDTGPAIPREVEAHLFEPLPTLKGQRGTGLGLALCREKVVRLGGSIEGGNTAAGGVRFVLSLPLPAGEAIA